VLLAQEAAAQYKTMLAAYNGMPPQPTELQQTLDRAKTRAKAYYGFNTLPGAAQEKWGSPIKRLCQVKNTSPEALRGLS